MERMTPPRVTKIEAVRKPKEPEKSRLKVAAYCRVSTSQDAQLESLEAQKEHYGKVIRRHEGWENAGIYYDEGITGTKKEKRPELMRLLEDCRAGRVDLVLTKSISRFARNTVDCLEMVRMLSSYKVGIFFEKENLNTLEMEDEFILTILGSLAENESLSISENEKWSVRRRFQKGTYRQAVAPYGYRLEDGKLIPDKGTAPVVQFIFSEACRGDGAHRIAKELNGRGIPAPKSGLWKSCTVDEILRNERYTGDAVYQKTFTDSSFVRHKNKGECGKFLHRDHHEAIISREQYEKVQIIRQQHRAERGTVDGSSTYAFTGKLVCAECGSGLKRAIIRGRSSGAYIAWVCQGHVRDKESCSLKSVEEESVKAAFTTLANKLVFSRKELLEPFAEALREADGGEESARIREIDRELDENAGKLHRLLSLAGENLLEPAVFNNAQAALSAERKDLNSRKAVLAERIRDGSMDRTEAERMLKRVREMEASEEFDEGFFRESVRKVHIYSRHEFGFELSCGLLLKEKTVWEKTESEA